MCRNLFSSAKPSQGDVVTVMAVTESSATKAVLRAMQSIDLHEAVTDRRSKGSRRSFLVSSQARATAVSGALKSTASMEAAPRTMYVEAELSSEEGN